MELNKWFKKGIPSDNYLLAMDENKDDLLHIYENFNVPNDPDFFKSLTDRKLRAIVITEDWCGDAMVNVPILLRIAETAGIEVRMLLRDDNLELMDQYLTNGKSRSIPIFIFIDQGGNEVAKWGPRAQEVQKIVDEERDNLPSKESDDYQEKMKEMFTKLKNAYRTDTDIWDAIYQSIKAKL